VLSPLSAFLLLQGNETLPLRIERHVENGRMVAESCGKDPRIEWVKLRRVCGGSPSPERAEISRRPGLLLMTFGVRGGYEAGKAFYDALKLIKRL